MNTIQTSLPALEPTPVPREPFWKSLAANLDPYSRANQFILDGCVFALSVIFAYLIRFEGWPSGTTQRQLFFWVPILLTSQLLVHWLTGVYRSVWRFFSIADALQVAKSVGLVTGVLVLLRVFVPGGGETRELLRIPFSVISIEALLSLTGCVGVRVLRRTQYNRQREQEGTMKRLPKRVLLYGAGRAGILLRKELEIGNDYDIVGFIDDDPQKVGSEIYGTRVLGSGDEISEIVNRWHIEEIVISMATASRQTLLRVLSKCRRANVPSKVIPSLREMLEERTAIHHFRELRPEDLLGRERVEVPGFEQDAALAYRGRRVLVTGGGGSIGSELVRQLARLNPSRVAILDKDENSVYELEQELPSSSVSLVAEPTIADIRDLGRLRAVFSDFRPEIVFHAAAHKHVPLMEKHPCEAVLNNVVGTRNLLELCAEFRVERFVFISSDKAVNPANVMGATKRIGEMLVQSYAADRGVRSACVRFGNVLGSRGSVLPLFSRQIARGGPVTVTHPQMVRYFMTIQEAVQLILCAGSLGQHGEIFVLDMGEPRNILELAREMILLSGLEPERDIQTAITGLRPGEKLYEELVSESETLQRTRFEKLSVITKSDLRVVPPQLSRLVDAARHNDSAMLYESLRSMGLPLVQEAAKARALAAASSTN